MVLLEKLIVSQVVKFPSYYITGSFITTMIETFWDIASCILVEVDDVSEVFTASFVKVQNPKGCHLHNLNSQYYYLIHKNPAPAHILRHVTSVDTLPTYIQ
jgi:hypothetical protein